MNHLAIIFFGSIGLATMATVLVLAVIVRGLTLNRYCISGRVRR